ncbi:N-glycosylase/DNA lyase OGG1 [Hibiscus syriacus]|uniref:DNA-(apurinic or apyrimidinic site) lyase n=1 Tax=Hibiscus syriacus TaxID=106335 RepID=A0A6A3CGC9_HIBSY|nr:N-glycosylase/DNA lyase OGG1 [Hibiscus syriacus]
MHSLKPSLAMKRPRPPSPPPVSSASTTVPSKQASSPPPPKSLHQPKTPPISSRKPKPHTKWVPLNLCQSELSLPLTFPTGQTFRWKQTGPLQYTGTIGPHLFAELAEYLKGARVLRQDPLECLVQFLCSSNNNIGRITKMVDFISSLGTHLGSVGGFEFHEFPSLERLSVVSEEELRQAGFGYRAKYVTGTGQLMLYVLYLESVPKVAACIALFSLDQHHAIPVDTHVWQIATKYLLPELAGARLTPKLFSRVADAFVSKYGEYAGWAQTLLFIAELPSQKALLPSHFWDIKGKKSAKIKD